MKIKRETIKILTITLLVLCFVLFLTGCGKINGGTLGSENNWEVGQGDLSEQIGSPDSVDEALFAPSYSYFVDFKDKDLINKTEYNSPTGEWFEKLGYGFPSGTMEAGEDYTITLFGHDKDGVEMGRDVHIELTIRDQNYEQSELIMEEVIHVDTITGEEKIYSNQLPDKENTVYLLSVEILDQQKQVEDTMVSVIYVPAPELNATLTTDKDVYQSSDEQATLILENAGPTFLSLGTYYTVEKKVNHSWKVVPLELDFEDIGIFTSPDDTYDQTIEIDQLTPGKYRIVKEFRADGLDLSATLAAEFTVE